MKEPGIRFQQAWLRFWLCLSLAVRQDKQTSPLDPSFLICKKEVRNSCPFTGGAGLFFEKIKGETWEVIYSHAVEFLQQTNKQNQL